jgi:hypothetical protein
MEGNFLNNNQNKKIEYIPVDDFDEGVDVDTGEIDPNTGRRVAIKEKDLLDAKKGFQINDDLKREILNAKREPIFIGDAFSNANEIDEKTKAERRRRGLCESCGGDPCRTDCDYR